MCKISCTTYTITIRIGDQEKDQHINFSLFIWILLISVARSLNLQNPFFSLASISQTQCTLIPVFCMLKSPELLMLLQRLTLYLKDCMNPFWNFSIYCQKHIPSLSSISIFEGNTATSRVTKNAWMYLISNIRV